MRIKKSIAIEKTPFNNQDKPKIFAQKNKLAVGFFDNFFEFVLKKYFYSVRVKNEQNYYLRNPNYANLFYGFHSCWWDGPLAMVLCRKMYDCNFHMMIKSLYRFPFLAKIGGFSIEKDSMQGILRSVNYSVNLLKNPENSLWIFPQGKVCFPECRPVIFETGLAHICSKLEGVNLIPVAYRYTFLRNENPEILVEIDKPIVVENGVSNKKLFTQNLQQHFENLLENQKKEISLGKIDEYEYLIQNSFDWKKTTEDLLKPLLRTNFQAQDEK